MRVGSGSGCREGADLQLAHEVFEVLRAEDHLVRGRVPLKVLYLLELYVLNTYSSTLLSGLALVGLAILTADYGLATLTSYYGLATLTADYGLATLTTCSSTW